MKEKKHKEDELHSNKKQDKELLLWLVKIFHADPVFAFHVSLFIQYNTMQCNVMQCNAVQNALQCNAIQILLSTPHGGFSETILL